eukprot:Nitzschia sp. Nitz4//scaffold10_size219509//218038//219285//NITZ4_001470-RA/size219509-processed-gene-0.108-mRNA-1//1//CDS//3329533046//6848//frame0
MSNPVEYWIYHERQEAMLCGQHALNNLVQDCSFTVAELSEIAHHLDQMELAFMSQNNEGGIHSKDYIQRVAEGSGNVDSSGNFSIEVLRAALQSRYNLELPNIAQQGVAALVSDVTDMAGFICHRHDHWFAIRKINGNFWNLNSTQPHPERISHFQLAGTIEGLQNSGYSVFCVPGGLPPPRTSLVSINEVRGSPDFWWKEQDLLQGNVSKASAATNAWTNVGTGMRLDGRNPVSSSATSTNQYEGLTEEEMIQIAMQESLQQSSAPQTVSKAVPLPPEPPVGAPGAVRIQFRLPSGGRAVRRFLSDDSVRVLYSYVYDAAASSQGREAELKYSFPPKDLETVATMTIGEAGLNGENIQCRWK